MSYLNRNHITNRIGGDGDGARTGQGIYEESSTPKAAIGDKLEFADGRVFRYGYTAAAINAAELVSQDVSATCLVETDNIVIAAANGFSPAAGSTKLQITLASITKDQYAGAYLQIANDGGDGTGEGIQYRIKSNSATGFTTSGKVDIELYDPIKVALTTASDIAITGGLWYNVRAATSATDYIISGVSPIAFTANYYGWFQTAGVALISSDGALAIGVNCTLSDSDAGHVQLKDAETEPLVGYTTYASDDDAHVGVVLQGLVP
ncbi:hypothetical protein CMI37_17620 [Candidatus Pacearchaeota archaeon]|nr:hypothetical protein [Candidatus Pacearchaeota archaeon]|tara:strand:- start:3588 stop:4379 length:792 start_codon:yes stop_codon:yes gene_type:complete